MKTKEKTERDSWYDGGATSIGDNCLSLPGHPHRGVNNPLRVLDVLWRLLIVLFRHGNQELYYHLCNNRVKESWTAPMEVEGVEVRHANSGNKVTFW